MKVYFGNVDSHRKWEVLVRDDNRPGSTPLPLNPRYDLSNHSPDGYAWGYTGSGPAQLCLALLADALGDDQRALRLYQDFKFFLIGGLPQDQGWQISDTIVRRLADIVEARQEAQRSATTALLRGAEEQT